MSALQDIALNLEAENAEQAVLAPAATPVAAGPLGRFGRWFAQLSIGGKITLFFSGNLAFALVAGLFVVAGYLQLGQRAETIRATHDAALKAERLLVQLNESQRHAEMLVADGDTARARAAREALDRAAASAAALSERAAASGIGAQDNLALIREGSRISAVRSPPMILTPSMPRAARARPPRSARPAARCSKRRRA